MKEIDQMLDQWIFNSIIRKQLRDLIIKEIKINNMKYDLTQDAITKKPNFFGRGSTPLVSLEEAKQTTKDYFTEYYDFNTKLKQYIYNVDKCKDVLAIQRYIEYAAIKGLTIKTKVNLSKLNRKK